MTDKIMLQGMTFWGYHGLKAEENTLGQPFVVDVELNLDLRPAGQSDDPAHTVDYGMVTEIAKKVITGKTCCLLETLAETIARTLLIEYPIQRVTVRVRKPRVPIPVQLDYAAVEVCRNRDDYRLSGFGE
ncbi:MAG: dihydroneopterin aldolase [bacterium]